jgi:hypothetical protein
LNHEEKLKITAAGGEDGTGTELLILRNLVVISSLII